MVKKLTKIKLKPKDQNENVLQKIFEGKMNPLQLEATPKKLESFAQFFGEPEKVKWVIDDFLPVGIVGYIAGDPGTRKSFVVLELIIRGCIESKKKYEMFPHVRINRRFKSIYVSAEDPRWEVKNRIIAIVDRIAPEYDMTPEEVFSCLKDAFYYDLQGEGESFFGLAQNDNTPREAKGFFNFELTIKTYRPHLVIVDTKSKVTFLRENSNEETAYEISRYEKVAKEYQCTIILIHHFGKASQGPRGASSFHANCRFGMEFLFPERDNQRSTKLNDNQRLVRINHSKSSYSQTVPPFLMEWTGLSYTFITKNIGNVIDVKKVKLRKRVLEFIRENEGATQQQIMSKIKSSEWPEAQVRNVVETLKKNKMIYYKNGLRKGLYLKEQDKDC